MASGASGILGVEIVSGQIHLIHAAVTGQKLVVFDFAREEVLIANPENAAQQLETLVARKKLGSLPAAFALSGPGVVHRLLDFPSMPSKELGVVITREVRAMSGVAGEDVVFDWEVVEEVESRGPKQVRVLVAMTAGTQVNETLQLLDRCGLRPALITTTPISLLRSLKFVQRGGKGQRVLFYIGSQLGYLLGVKDGAWNFYRDFSTRSSERSSETWLEGALREANRALLYYRQHYQEGEDIEFLVAGEKGLESLQAQLMAELGVQGTIVRPEPEVDLAPLGGRADLFREAFPSFVIPLGLVAAAAVQPGINLAPQPVRTSVAWGNRFDLSFLYRPALSVALLVVLLGVHFMVVRAENRYENLLKERRLLYNQWLPAIQAAEESRALHEKEELLAQAIGSARVDGRSWLSLFKMLSRVVPPELFLQTMSVQRGQDEWLITLKGEVVSPDSFVAQAALNRFYQGLKSSEQLERIEVLPLETSSGTKKVEGSMADKPASSGSGEAGQGPQEEVGVKRTTVQFEVRGRSKAI
jgi:Tfp pilus assembly PilM family ATPase